MSLVFCNDLLRSFIPKLALTFSHDPPTYPKATFSFLFMCPEIGVNLILSEERNPIVSNLTTLYILERTNQ